MLRKYNAPKGATHGKSIYGNQYKPVSAVNSAVPAAVQLDVELLARAIVIRFEGEFAF